MISFGIILMFNKLVRVFIDHIPYSRKLESFLSHSLSFWVKSKSGGRGPVIVSIKYETTHNEGELPMQVFYYHKVFILCFCYGSNKLKLNSQPTLISKTYSGATPCRLFRLSILYLLLKCIFIKIEQKASGCKSAECGTLSTMSR